MDIYGINCIYEMGADNRTIYTPFICPGANNSSIYRVMIFIYLTNFIDSVAWVGEVLDMYKIQ